MTAATATQMLLAAWTLLSDAREAEGHIEGPGDRRESHAGPLRPAELEDASTWHALLPGASNRDYELAAAANPCIRGACSSTGRTAIGVGK